MIYRIDYLQSVVDEDIPKLSKPVGERIRREIEGDGAAKREEQPACCDRNRGEPRFHGVRCSTSGRFSERDGESRCASRDGSSELRYHGQLVRLPLLVFASPRVLPKPEKLV